ncbi:MAG TPA: SDR family oxidoreductase [Puia sp.]|jgi:NAD(P)-dependent dehydrogenase (short-subunit alcohol dehydrogenase family)
MLLKNKNAVIYGGGASLAGAVALAMAREGANIFLAGRNIPSLEKIKGEIIQKGGRAEVAAVDAMDGNSIRRHLQQVIDSADTVDISFNLIGIHNVQNIPLVEMNLPEFIQPITDSMTTQFLTTTVAGEVMARQGSGVILSLTATPGGIGYALTGGFGPACAAIEGYSRNLASELGPHGVRVVNIRSAGSPDSRPFVEAIQSMADTVKPILKRMAEDTMLKKLPPMADIANTAVFLSSYLAASITGVTIDATVGTITQINRPATDRVPFDREGT